MTTYVNPPLNCDICKVSLPRCFVDGKTVMGPWACMCLGCFSKYGVGIGQGKGQRYEKQHNATFKKTAG
jgi:hypothetical protein